MDCLFYEQNEQKEPRQEPVFQVLASYLTNYQHLFDYSSTAACAALFGASK